MVIDGVQWRPAVEAHFLILGTGPPPPLPTERRTVRRFTGGIYHADPACLSCTSAAASAAVFKAARSTSWHGMRGPLVARGLERIHARDGAALKPLLVSAQCTCATAALMRAAAFPVCPCVLLTSHSRDAATGFHAAHLCTLLQCMSVACRLPPPLRPQGVQGDARAALVPDARGHGGCRGVHPLVGEGSPCTPQVRPSVCTSRAWATGQWS
jgi:hypothetical protein